MHWLAPASHAAPMGCSAPQHAPSPAASSRPPSHRTMPSPTPWPPVSVPTATHPRPTILALSLGLGPTHTLLLLLSAGPRTSPPLPFLKVTHAPPPRATSSRSSPAVVCCSIPQAPSPHADLAPSRSPGQAYGLRAPPARLAVSNRRCPPLPPSMPRIRTPAPSRSRAWLGLVCHPPVSPQLVRAQARSYGRSSPRTMACSASARSRVGRLLSPIPAGSTPYAGRFPLAGSSSRSDQLRPPPGATSLHRPLLRLPQVSCPHHVAHPLQALSR